MKNFVIINELDGNAEMQLATESEVSTRIDMGDTIPFGCKVFCLDEGSLHEVYLGPQSDEDDAENFIYASSPMMIAANGVPKQIGTVQHTNH